MPIRILLVDDHPIVRDGIQIIIDSQKEMAVVGTASDSQTAIEQADLLRPAVIIMDIVLPGTDGIEVLRSLRQHLPGTKIIMLTMLDSPEYVKGAVMAEAAGYVLKNSAADEIITAIRTVFAGGCYFGKGVDTGRLQDTDTGIQSKKLTPREEQILKLVIDGKTSKQIGELVSLSASSVETYRSRIMKKLGVNSLSGLVKTAIKTGIMTIAAR